MADFMVRKTLGDKWVFAYLHGVQIETFPTWQDAFERAFHLASLRCES